MQLHTLKRTTPQKSAVRIGRGSTRGKTSGRGHKGQKSRAGHKIRPAVRDTIKQIPKMRGHGKNRSRTVNSGKERAQAVNVGRIDTVFESGAHITPSLLLARGLVRRSGGRTPRVKILSKGTISKKVTIAGCEISASARTAVEKAGGEVL